MVKTQCSKKQEIKTLVPTSPVRFASFESVWTKIAATAPKGSLPRSSAHSEYCLVIPAETPSRPVEVSAEDWGNLGWVAGEGDCED